MRACTRQIALRIISAGTLVISIAILTGCPDVVDPDTQRRLNDRTDPVIEISSPESGSAYLEVVTITGRVTDLSDEAGGAGEVSTLSYAIVGETESGTVEIGDGGAFTVQIDSGSWSGSYTIQLTAVDWNSNESTAEITLVPPRELTSFGFLAANNAGIDSDVLGTFDGTSVTVVVPSAANKADLCPTFEIEADSVEVAGVPQESGVDHQDFTSPVIYRVLANDGTYTDYTVTVTSVDDKELLTFWFRAADNEGVLSADVEGVVGGSTVNATVPFDTDVTGLVAEFTFTGDAVLVDGTEQASGVTANDFTSPADYVVRAQDSSTITYAVTVTVLPDPSKEMTSFEFPSVSAVGVINDGSSEIDIAVPLGTDLTTLTATFTHTGATAHVGAAEQTSGSTLNDFSSVVTYTVTADDATTRDYDVYVHVAVETTAVEMLGSFDMGVDTDGAPGTEYSEPVHTVPSISAFRMGIYEVTDSQWSSVATWASDHGYTFERSDIAGEGPLEPVSHVTWYDAIAWLNALSEKEDLTPCYYTDGTHGTVYRGGSTPDLSNSSVDWTATGYRLPTEAEWEMAARYIDGSSWDPGDEHSGYNVDADYTNCAVIGSVTETAPVGSLTANSLGIHDMTGNVREWCWDRWGTYTTASPYTDPDPRGPDSGTQRVNRGRGWDDSLVDIGTSVRAALIPSLSGAWSTAELYGLRVVTKQ